MDMPVIQKPTVNIQDRHEDLFLIQNNPLELPFEAQPIIETVTEPPLRITRSYNTKKDKEVKRPKQKKMIPVTTEKNAQVDHVKIHLHYKQINIL